MNSARRIALLFVIAGIVAFAISTPARTCPFCEEKGVTLLGQFEEAQFVLLGQFKDAKPGAGNALDGGEATFVIQRVLKSHDAVKGKTQITVSRPIRDTQNKYLIFCDLYKGRIDPYKGMPVANDSEMVRYVEGMMQLKEKPQPERLRYAFDFLNSPEIEVAMDAYREFAKADYSDYKDMAKKLPAQTIAGWLQDPKTPPYRYGLYASLLGHCGNAQHAKLLRGMIDDPEKRKGSGLFGLMAAYMMLEPKEGWAMLTEMVQKKEDRNGQPRSFLVRYAGLQTMRFMWESRPELINKDLKVAQEEIVKGVATILKVGDMADFAIEDMRKWKRWEYSDQILDMYGTKGFNTPTIRKSILRYALMCPTPRAAAFVKTLRAKDKDWVDETQELLELEVGPAITTPAKK